MSQVWLEWLKRARDGTMTQRETTDGILIAFGSDVGMNWMACLLFVYCANATAQVTPVGVWKTFDDGNGRGRSLVRIEESSGVFSGRVVALLDAEDIDSVCEKCPDTLKGQPVLGLVIIDGVRRHLEVWDGGHILDPDDGTSYRVRLRLMDNGTKLEVRGYYGPFFRTQVWIRTR